MGFRTPTRIRREAGFSRFLRNFYVLPFLSEEDSLDMGCGKKKHAESCIRPPRGNCES